MTSFRQMAFIDAAELYLRRWKRYDLTHLSRRRLVCLLLLALVVVFYIVPFFLHWLWSSPVTAHDSNIDIIGRELRPYVSEAAQLDSSIYTSFDEPGAHFYPYIGNGKFGLPLNDNHPFYISGDKALDLALPFYPIVSIKTFGANKQNATVLRFVDGVVQKITSFDYMSQSVVVHQTFYAHREISPLLIQEVRIHNPTQVPLMFGLGRTGWQGKQHLKSEHLNFKSSDKVQYHIAQGELQTAHAKPVGFVVVYPEVAESVEIPPMSKKTLTFRTLMNYTEAVPASELSGHLVKLNAYVREAAPKLLELMSTDLLKRHVDAWGKLWSSGFSISWSKAKGALNGDVINATIYYVLSQQRTYSSEFDLKKMADSSESLTKSLISRPDRCYAVSQKHLELGIHPKELHRDYHLKRLRYDDGSLINITVTVGEEYKSTIFVSIDKRAAVDREFYACDAGCLDPAVQLSEADKQFPVKLTEPLTAILYVSSDKQHIDSLKHAIHVKEVAVAPAHETHIIALHRHGHQLGGLPIFFWIAILCLVVIFHIFLAKLIYNEYCAGGSGNSRYAV
ncbi:Uncharacterized protein HDE_13631 [Halotydeus destructor]|nr:Uncharacterized protein HDE_13631 [Halotydeus destructor]